MTTYDRIERLRNALVEHTSGRVCLTEDAMRVFARIAYESYSSSRTLREADRKADFLCAFADRWPCTIEKDELIVGSQRFGMLYSWNAFLSPDEREAMQFRGNHGHIIVDYGQVLRLGISGLLQQVRSAPQGINSKAFQRALEAFSLYIRRHADAAAREAERQLPSGRAEELRTIAANCRWISNNPPQTFWQGLQLVWFVQVFLHAEGANAAVSFGRFDQYLWPLLENDLQAKTITVDLAEELLSCFWIKCCEGDESQNLTLGGVDEAGNNAENLLSLLCLKVARTLKVWQPSISVRIHKNTSEAFWTESLELCLCGIGMPSFFNDSPVIASLQALDIPIDRARDWGIVGCYEATTQGDTCALTTMGHWNLAEVLLQFLESDPASTDFSAFCDGLKRCCAASYDQRLRDHQQMWEWLSENCGSPFQSACLGGCIESGRMAEEAGARFSLLGTNILGLGTLIDSLLVIKTLVFDEKSLSLAEMKEQVARDFPDAILRTRCRNLPNRYGTDTEFTNRLAEDFSRFLSDLVLSSRIEAPGRTVRPYPGLFRFGSDIYNQTPATPDGRRAKELLSYGCGPSSFTKGLTAVSILNSSAHIAHDRFACGNPLLISLPRSDVSPPHGSELLGQIVKAYFRRGGFHLHFNILNADQLREAQKRPEAFSELMVRVSGFSAKFQAIDKTWQDAIIERTEKSM